MIIILSAWTVSAQAASRGAMVKNGNELYAQTDFQGAVEKYNQALKKDAESDIINFNLGSALYKNGHYVNALEHLQKALLSESDSLKEKAHYNLGNTLYKSGRLKEEKKIDQAIASFKASLEQYAYALQLNEENRDARFNYEFVKNELERLKEKKEEQPQNQDQSWDSQQQGSSQQQDQNQQSQSKDSQQSQDSPGSDQQQQEDRSSQQQKSNDDRDSSTEESQEQQDDQSQTDEHREREDKQDQSEQNQQDSEQDGSEDQKSSSVNAGINELTEQEAQNLLRKYEQSQAPQGLLNVFQRGQGGREVLKDW